MDSKDVSTGVSSPPRAFVDKQFLNDTRLLLKESGKFICLYSQFSIPLDSPLLLTPKFPAILLSWYYYEFVPLWIHAGLFLTNVASRNKELRTETLRSISCIYPQLISIPIPEDINELVVGLPTGMSDHVSTSISATLEFDSVEVKSALANLATVISKNSGGKFEVGSILKEWTNLLSSSKPIHTF